MTPRIGKLPVDETTIRALVAAFDFDGQMNCLVCGCGGDHFNSNPCHWVFPFLCSNCASGYPRDSHLVLARLDEGIEP